MSPGLQGPGVGREMARFFAICCLLPAASTTPQAIEELGVGGGASPSQEALFSPRHEKAKEQVICAQKSGNLRHR